MNKLVCYNSDGSFLEHFTQWDVGQSITIKGLSTTNAPFIHFWNKFNERALVVASTIENGSVVAPVPNILLQYGVPIFAYLYYQQDNNSAKTMYSLTINVVPRAKPEDYEFVENIEYTNWVELTKEANNLISEWKQTTETATEHANSAAELATNSAALADEATNKATVAANSASAAASSAISATSAANTAAQNAANATTLAEIATDDAQNAAISANEAATNAKKHEVQFESGCVISLSDSAHAPLQGLRIFGKTTQKTTTGKNLYSGNTLNGYIDGTEWMNLAACKTVYISCKPSTYYTVSKKAGTRFVVGYAAELPADDGDVILESKMSNSASTITIKSGETAKYLLAWVYNSNSDTSITATDMLNSVQIEIGETATDYEPYTGGIPSPNPESPQPLESVGDGGSVGVTVTGENIFGDMALAEKIINLANASHNTERKVVSFQALNVTGNTVFDKFKPDTQYTIVLYGKNLYTEYPSTNLAFYYADGSYTSIPNFSVPDDYSCLVYTTPKNKSVTALKLMNIAGTTALQYDRCGIFEGVLSEADFEPYNGQSVTIQKPTDAPVLLPGIPVSSSGNYTDENGQQWVCDEVDFESGVYVQRVNQYLADGSSGFYNSSIAMYMITLEDAVKQAYNRNTAYCSHYAYGANSNSAMKDKHFKIHFASGNPELYFKDSSYASASEWKASLAENPVTVLYQLEEEKIIPLTAEELAQYAALHTNYPNTTIFNDGGAGMEVQYATPLSAVPIIGARMAGNIDMNNHNLTGIPDPENETDAVNKKYVGQVVKAEAERVDQKVDTLRGIVSKFHSNIVEEAKGETIILDDASDMELAGLRIFGKTNQNDIPTPDAPVPLESVGDGGSVKIQTYPALKTVKNDVLAGIAVTSGGNYTDENGQQYIADYRDLTRGMAVQMIGAYTFTGNESIGVNGDILRVTLTGAPLYNRARTIAMMCNRFRPASRGFSSYDSVRDYVADGYFTQYYYVGNKNNDVYFRSSEFAGFTVDDAKAWFAANETTVLYQLESPIETTIQEEELAQYAEKYGSNVIAYGKTFQEGMPTLNVPATSENTTDVVQTLTVQKPAEVPVLLPGIPVTSGGNYIDENGQQWVCDEVDLASGKYIQRVDKCVITGTEDTVINGNSVRIIPAKLTEYLYIVNSTMICNRFAGARGYGSLADANTYMVDGGFSYYYSSSAPNSPTRVFFFKNSAFTDVDTAKAWFAANITEILFQLAKPIEHAMSADELAQYAALHTNYPDTTIFNDGGADMEVKYVADTKLYVDKKFQKLAAALVNNT